MSFRKEYSAGFAEKYKIGFKDQIQDQIKVCREAVTSNNIYLIRPSIIALQLLITPRIADKIYFQSIEELNEKWKKEYEIKLKKYEDEIEKVMCPDVIDKPKNDMPLDYMLAIYSTTQALFERRKLLLEQERVETL